MGNNDKGYQSSDMMASYSTLTTTTGLASSQMPMMEKTEAPVKGPTTQQSQMNDLLDIDSLAIGDSGTVNVQPQQSLGGIDDLLGDTLGMQPQQRGSLTGVPVLSQAPVYNIKIPYFVSGLGWIRD